MHGSAEFLANQMEITETLVLLHLAFPAKIDPRVRVFLNCSKWSHSSCLFIYIYINFRDPGAWSLYSTVN